MQNFVRERSEQRQSARSGAVSNDVAQGMRFGQTRPVPNQGLFRQTESQTQHKHSTDYNTTEASDGPDRSPDRHRKSTSPDSDSESHSSEGSVDNPGQDEVDNVFTRHSQHPEAIWSRVRQFAAAHQAKATASYPSTSPAPSDRGDEHDTRLGKKRDQQRLPYSKTASGQPALASSRPFSTAPRPYQQSVLQPASAPAHTQVPAGIPGPVNQFRGPQDIQGQTASQTQRQTNGKPSPPSQDPVPSDELCSLPYETLKNEPFDTANPPTIDQTSNAVTQGSLSHILTLPPQEQAQHFANLTLPQWEQAGDDILDQLSSCIDRLRKLRTQRRNAARDFESEIERRHDTVVAKTDSTTEALRSIREMGGRVLPVASGRRP